VDIFLISRSGRFLATTTDEAELPLKTKAIQDTPYQQLFGELYRDRNNPTYLLAEDPFDNKNYYYSSAVVDTGQWMVVVRKSEQEVGTPIWQQLLLSLATIATALLVFLFIGVAMARSLSHHIHRAKEAADLLASGALPEKLALDTTTNDEIGHMNRSINQVLKEHRAITQACRALATGDYSYRLEPRSEQDQLAGAINQIGEHIQRKEAQSRARLSATDNGSKPSF
jgi:methyl-accepting chemotaxis protein